VRERTRQDRAIKSWRLDIEHAVVNRGRLSDRGLETPESRAVSVLEPVGVCGYGLYESGIALNLEDIVSSSLRVAGLFAGIGGIELGFHRALGDGVDTVLLCESWTPAQDVLAARFPDVELHPDVQQLTDLPAGLDVLTAGFPCTDLSQRPRPALEVLPLSFSV
jgi:hypothetical protein